jgi:hypothetical protein
VDQDCDGSDLEPSDATGIFVAPTGTDEAGCGTQASPCRTLSYGVNRGEQANKPVFLAEGGYAPMSAETTSVSIFGGYESGTWTRDIEAYPTVIRGDEFALLRPGVGVSVAFEGLTLERANPYAGTLLMAGLSVNGANATVTVSRTTIRAGDTSGANTNCYGVYVNDNNMPVTLVNNDISCGNATGYGRGVFLGSSSLTALGNVIDGGTGQAAGLSAVGVLVSGSGAQARLINNFVVGGRGNDVHGVHITPDSSPTNVVLLAHNIFIGGFDAASATTTGVSLDQAGHTVLVNNIIDGGGGTASFGVFLEINLPEDDREVVLLHNDLWGPAPIQLVGSETSTWDLAEVNDCIWEDCVESAGNFSADPLLVDRYALDPHIRAGSPCVNRGGDPSPWYKAGVLASDVDGETRAADSSDVGADEL